MYEESLFAAALDRPTSADREAFLTEACGDDLGLRRRVEQLLAAHAQSVGILDQNTSPYGGAAGPGERPGAVVAGRYKLLEPIGEGGMGVVFRAEQATPVQRKVALKVIKAGMDSSMVVARFEAERQALALMDHPNIARVFDAGQTDSGRPFFVMELVNGVPITDYCDQARLNPDERLELFIPVCRAIQHAHQKGIIHRDIKPSNVLVTIVDGKAVPKVIDFGVAKAIEQRLTERSLFTHYGTIVGTLEYMSPEQAGPSGADVDTRSDVFSLGVLLYELLTSTTPLQRERVRDAAYSEVLRRIKEEEPPKPSTRLSSSERLPSIAAIRKVEPARLTRLVRGELDWIVMKSLEKDRARRYETADGLARDVQRHLDGDAVEAGPPSATYRLRRLARKHRAALFIASSFAVLLIIAVAATSYLAYRASKAEGLAMGRLGEVQEATAVTTKALLEARIEAEKFKAMNDFLSTDLLTQATPDNNAVEDHVTLLEVLDRAAAKVGERFADQPEVEAALRETIANTYQGLASWEKAEAQFRAIQEKSRRRDPKSSASYKIQGRIANLLGQRGRIDAAVVKMAEDAAEGLARTLGSDHPDTLEGRGIVAESYRAVGRAKEAIALHEANLKALESSRGPDHPNTLISRGNLGNAYRDAGRTAEAITMYGATLKARELTLGSDHPDTLTSRNNLAAAFRATGRTEEAITLLTANLKAMESRLGPDHPNTLAGRNNLALAYRAAGRTAEAITLCEANLKAMESRLGPDHPNTLAGRNNLAYTYLDAGRMAEAEALTRAVLESQRRTLSAESPVLADTLSLLGSNLSTQRRFAEAEPLLRECLRIREARLPEDWTTFEARSSLGGALTGLKRYDQAEMLVITGYEGMRARAETIRQTAQPRLSSAASRVIAFYEAWGKPEKVAEWKMRLGRSELPEDVFAR